MQAGQKLPFVGVLLAGGAAKRMGGGDKCLLSLGGEPLLAHTIRRLRPQVDTMILNANGDPARFAAFGLPVTADPVPDLAGPLAGILAGMAWTAANRPAASWIVSAATDTPFLPADLVARLADAVIGRDGIAVARTRSGLHQVFGLFPVGLATDLRCFIETAGTLKVRDWLDTQSVVAVDFAVPADGPDPFFNINTPADLASAEEALVRVGPQGIG